MIPQATSGTDLDAFVGGQTASYVDLASAISSKLLLVILCVIALGFLVLMTAFRSMLIPTQAAVANVLSVCAAFGVVTACFQKGWGLSLVGLDTASIDYGQSKLFETHRVLFEKDIPAFENVAHLSAVPATGAFVIALPMKIRGGSGGPLRIVAVLAEGTTPKM